MGFVQQAIYCFRKVLNLEPYDMDALWDRSYLLRVSGDARRVRPDGSSLIAPHILNAPTTNY